MKEVQKVNDVCKLLFQDVCKNTFQQDREENFLILIADSVLQQGMNYKNFVLPRLIYIKTHFCDIYCISQLSTSPEDIENILQVKNTRKVNTFKDIIELFQKENLETYHDIVEWLSDKSNFCKLLEINGFGTKTLDYMLNLFGYQSIPIDRHLFSFLKLCLIETNNYQFASSIFNDIAEKNNFCKNMFDKEIWNYVRSLRI